VWPRDQLMTVYTVRIRESVPDHDPDPERTATVSTHTQNRCHQCSPNEFNFGDDPDHRPGSRSPKSEIRIHWINDYADVRRRSALSDHF